jgi:hypothetical protein
VLIGEVEKNTRELIRVTIEKFKGHRFIDLRVYYLDSEGTGRPTQKGIALTESIIDEVMELLTRGREALGKTNNKEAQNV